MLVKEEEVDINKLPVVKQVILLGVWLMVLMLEVEPQLYLMIIHLSMLVVDNQVIMMVVQVVYLAVVVMRQVVKEDIRVM